MPKRDELAELREWLIAKQVGGLDRHTDYGLGVLDGYRAAVNKIDRIRRARKRGKK